MDSIIFRWDDIEQINIVNKVVDEVVGKFVNEVVYNFSCCLSSRVQAPTSA